MSAIAQSRAHPYGRAIALHSLGWLAAANLVGVWLAISLLWPAVGDWIAPLTYGRWSALHLDWQLYGWCALPIVGALFVWCFDDAAPVARRDANLALAGWSLALLAGGVAWLGGKVSGKLFLARRFRDIEVHACARRARAPGGQRGHQRPRRSPTFHIQPCPRTHVLRMTMNAPENCV